MGTKSELYSRYLRHEGYRPSVDDDGDVRVQIEGGNYLLLANEGDQGFFQLVYPRFWKIESSQELGRALIAASYATGHVKVAKVWVNDDVDDVNAAVECFFEQPQHFAPVFGRSVAALQLAVRKFKEKMRGAD